MSIEKKKPTKEFYSALDDVISHQIKSREAFDKAIEIGRKQDFDDFTIELFIKDYLKEKIPKTSLYRYIKELNPNPVPLEQIYYNNVLEVKDQTVGELLTDAKKQIRKMEKNLLELAKMLEEKGYSKEKMISKIKRELKLEGCDQMDIDFADSFLRSQYKE